MKGILFKPDMIQAIIEGRKTQTRRLGGLKLINDHEPQCWQLSPINNGKAPFMFTDAVHQGSDRYFPIECKPRYQVGETVYIKEAWYYDMFSQETTHGIRDKNAVYYRLDGEVSEQFECWTEFEGWRSPMMMPEWAARYFLVITDVRAERLQEITYNDRIAEGIDITKTNFPGTAFKELWNFINKDKWESNPWVFVYIFRIGKEANGENG
jgi:hypothetical protein